MYSYSKISTFIQCPKKYEYQYLIGIPGLPKTEALVKGGDIHLILENIEKYQEYQKTGCFDIAENIDDLQEIFDNPKYIQIVDNFINSPLGEILKCQSSREVEIFLDKDFNPTETDKYFVGYIDRINLTKNGIEIIDFKTGKYKDIRYQDFNQLGLYGIYIIKKYNLKSLKLRYVYVEHNKENTLDIDNTFIENLISKYKGIINELENTKEFKQCKTKLCDYCPFKLHCFKDIGESSIMDIIDKPETDLMRIF